MTINRNVNSKRNKIIRMIKDWNYNNEQILVTLSGTKNATTISEIERIRKEIEQS